MSDQKRDKSFTIFVSEIFQSLCLTTRREFSNFCSGYVGFEITFSNSLIIHEVTTHFAQVHKSSYPMKYQIKTRQSFDIQTQGCFYQSYVDNKGKNLNIAFYCQQLITILLTVLCPNNPFLQNNSSSLSDTAFFFSPFV